jgi:hypothetical protein
LSFSELSLLEVFVGAKLRVKEFDCDSSIELSVQGQIDCAHPAGTQLFDYSVMAD